MREQAYCDRCQPCKRSCQVLALQRSNLQDSIHYASVIFPLSPSCTFTKTVLEVDVLRDAHRGRLCKGWVTLRSTVSNISSFHSQYKAIRLQLKWMIDIKASAGQPGAITFRQYLSQPISEFPKSSFPPFSILLSIAITTLMTSSSRTKMSG